MTLGGSGAYIGGMLEAREKAARFLAELNALSKRSGIAVVPVTVEVEGALVLGLELRERDGKHAGELRVVAGVEDRTVVR